MSLDAEDQDEDDDLAQVEDTVQELDPVPETGLLARLRSFMRTEQEQLEATQAQIEERRGRVREIEHRYKILLRERDGLQSANGAQTFTGLRQRLASADAQFEAYKVRREQLKVSLHTDWWGNDPHATGGAPDVGYSVLLALEAAINDYPKARAVLADQLSKLESKIAAFEREHLANGFAGQ